MDPAIAPTNPSSTSATSPPIAPIVASALSPDPSARAVSATLLLGQHRVAALIDSGASHTLVASSLRDRLGLVPDGPWSIPLASASGNDMGITTSRLLALGFGTHVVHWRCGVASGLPLPLLIGADLLSSQRCALDLGALRLRFPAAPPVPLSISAAAPALAASCLPTATHLLLARDTVIPGRSEVVVSAMVPASSRPPLSGTFLALSALPAALRAVATCAAGVLDASSLEHVLPLVLLHHAPRPLVLKAGTLLATLAPLDLPNPPAVRPPAGPTRPLTTSSPSPSRS